MHTAQSSTAPVVKILMALAVAALLVSARLEALQPQTIKSPTPTAALPSAAHAEHHEVLKRYCFTCHNDRMKANFAGLSLEALNLANVSENASTWEKVVAKLRAGTMPPAGMSRPDPATYDALASWLESEIDKAWLRHPNPGRGPSLHRLNRTEYQNAIRDLLGIEGLDFSVLLPTDDVSYGFDNMAGALGMSPTHMERYLTAAGTLSRIAVGDVSIAATSERFLIPSDLSQDDRIESLPAGTRGGALVRYYFPVDGEYVIRLRIVGALGAAAAETNEAEVTVDGERVHLETVLPVEPKYRAALTRQTGLFSDQEIRLPIKGGLRDIGATFIQKTSAQIEDILQPFSRPAGINVNNDGLGPLSFQGPYILSMSILGPVKVTGSGNTPSRARIFVCRPQVRSQEAACARRIFATLARHAYRRPVTVADVNVLWSFYATERMDGGTFDQGIAAGLQRLLVDPQFLLRVERDPTGIAPNTAYPLSDVELASRLSFFLWSSIPDEELLAVAAESKLKDPAVLAREVRRMLGDRRSNALIENFFGQWLRLRNLEGIAPDPSQFPNFDDNLRRAFRRETELFAESILREDRSVLDLLTANYTFVNERLARHYGIRKVYGPRFRRITVSDEARRGILGHGSLLTVTSQPNRTSPVVRGKFMLESILGSPPPAPPPNVPALKAESKSGKPLSMRAALDQHRANAVCATCHRTMDPLGFALENFDAVGAWRTREVDGTPIDASGTLPDGTKFDGVDGLRVALLRKPEVFVTTMTERLLTYALGRGVEYSDRPALRMIVRGAAADDYRFAALILGIVQSVPFQQRRSAPDSLGTATARRQ